MRKNKKGEIATFITLVTFFVIGVASIASLMALKKPLTTSTKAAVACSDPNWSCADECVTDQKTKDMFAGIYGDADAALGWRQEKAQNCGLTESQCNLTDKCEPLNKPTIPPSSVGVTCDSDVWSCGGECASQETRNIFRDGLKWREEKAKNCGITVDQCTTVNTCGVRPGSTQFSSSGLCECVNGQPAGPCNDVNPCGSPSGSCTYGDWKDECAGSNQSCNSDAGVTHTYWCGKTGWIFQYPNCVTWCKTEYLANPPKTPMDLCKGKQAGDQISINDFLATNPTLSKEVVKDNGKLLMCDGNVGELIELTPFCDQFGQIKAGPGKSSGKSCLTTDDEKKKNCVDNGKQGNLFKSCAKQICNQSTGLYYCIDQYWDKNCGIQERKGVTTSTTCSKTGQVPVITGRPVIKWSAPPARTNVTPIIHKLSSSTATPTPAPGAATSSPAAVSTNGYCPDAQGLQIAYCSKDQPAQGYVKTYLSCYNFWDSCWVPGPGSLPGDKTYLYPTPVPEYKTVEIDDGFESWNRWITHSQVCDDVGQKSFLGINGIIVKNCRDPEYLQGITPGKVFFRYKKNSGVKTILCALGGVGSCIDLP